MYHLQYFDRDNKSRNSEHNESVFGYTLYKNVS